MNIIQRVTWKSMRQNKKRTIVTIFGVAICVSMLTAISILSSSLFDALSRSYYETNGSKDVLLMDIANTKASKLLKDKRVASAMRLNEIGYANFQEYKLHIIAIDIEDPQLQRIHVTKGKLPTKENEIVISKDIRNANTASFHIGDTISLPVYDIRYEEIGDQGEVKEVQESIGTNTYNITGFVEPMNAMVYANGLDNPNFSFAFTNYNATAKHNTSSVVAIRLHDITDFYKQVESISCTYGGCGGYEMSNGYLSLRGVDSMGIYSTYIPVILILIGIILMGGISLIYNAFSISLSERSRYLGMLSSVGATKKQKRNSVFFEATLIGVIAIPFGLLVGMVGISITLHLLNPYVASVIELNNVPFETVIDLRLLLVTILLSIIILFVSAWIPARRASKITAISAIQQHQDISIRKKDVKTNQIVKFVFGVEAELGLKNMKRNRMRYRSTLSSLIICIILFMSAQFFSTTMSDTTGMMMNYTDADVLINFFSSNDSIIDFNQKEIKEIRTLSSVKSSVLYGEDTDLYIKDTAQLSDDAKAYIKRNENTHRLNSNLTQEDILRPNLTLQILSDEDFAQYCEEIGSDPADFDGNSSSIIVVNQRSMMEKINGVENYHQMQSMKVSEGDQIQCYSILQNDQSTTDVQPISLRVEKVTNKAPSFHKIQKNYVDLMFICNDKSYVKIKQDLQALGYGGGNLFYEMQIISNDIHQLEQKLEVITSTFPYSMSVNNVAQQRVKNAQRDIFINTMLYGFVVLILLICMANIRNSISTSMELRRREFAMIKSIGITKCKFYKMICFETLFYGVKALLYGIPLGIATMYLLYQAFTRGVFHFQFLLHWETYAWMIVALFMLLFATMLYAVKKIGNDNIVETIRKESI